MWGWGREEKIGLEHGKKKNLLRTVAAGNYLLR